MKKILTLAAIAAIIVYLYNAGIIGPGHEPVAAAERNALCIVCEADNLFGFDFEELRDEILDTVKQRGYVMAVAADGRPYTYAYYEIPIPDKHYTERKQEQMDQDTCSEILAELKKISPKTAENDILAGIKLGAKLLNNCKEASSRKMIVAASGLQREGNMRFQDFSCKDENGKDSNSLLTCKPVEVVKQLADNYAIPDLSGIDSLTWYDCGVGCGEQSIPDADAQAILNLWRAISDKAGCPLDEAYSSLSAEPFTSKVSSTVIRLESNDINIKNIEAKFSDEQLHFVANKAEMTDEQASKELLKPYASKIKSACSAKSSNEPVVYLVGFTATVGGKDSCQKLSLARAEKVKQLLVSLGCPEYAIKTRGVGQGGPAGMRTDDTAETDPVKLEALRSKNRVVYLLGTESEYIKELETY